MKKKIQKKEKSGKSLISCTFSAWAIPFASKSSITAEKILDPLKYKFVSWFIYIR